MNKEKFTQFEAAVCQLDTAIKLFYEGSDFLSVCTLSGAADRIFEDIYAHERDLHLQRQLVQHKGNAIVLPLPCPQCYKTPVSLSSFRKGVLLCGFYFWLWR